MVGNDVPPVPSAPSVPEPVDYDALARESLGTTWAEFEKRHRFTAKAIKARVGDPLEFILNTLKDDAAYQALLAETEDELSIANIIRVISGVALAVLEKFLMVM